MRVLAVAHALAKLAGDDEAGGQLLLHLPRVPGGDRRVVGGGAREGLRREAGAKRARYAAFPQRGNERGIVAGLGHDGDPGGVLGGGADHRRPADVDVLDRLRRLRALRDGRLEGIEVHDQAIDPLDAEALHRGAVVGVVAKREQPAVDARVQRLHAAVHHLRHAGQRGDVDDRKPGVGERPRGAAGRDDLDAVRDELPRQLHQP